MANGDWREVDALMATRFLSWYNCGWEGGTLHASFLSVEIKVEETHTWFLRILDSVHLQETRRGPGQGPGRGAFCG